MIVVERSSPLAPPPIAAPWEVGDRANGSNDLAALFDAYHDGVRRFAMSVCRDASAADDLSAEAFARLADARRRGVVIAEPRPWLMRVVSNLAVSKARRENVAQHWQHMVAVREERAPSPEAAALARERHDALHAALAQLAPDHRTALLLAATGFLGPEIARLLGRSEAATRTMMCRARARIREMLEPSDEVVLGPDT